MIIQFYYWDFMGFKNIKKGVFFEFNNSTEGEIFALLFLTSYFIKLKIFLFQNVNFLAIMDTPMYIRLCRIYGL